MAHSRYLPRQIKLELWSVIYSAPWKLWLRRHKTRLQLHDLLQNDPERVTADLGLNKQQALLECKKPFWIE